VEEIKKIKKQIVKKEPGEDLAGEITTGKAAESSKGLLKVPKAKKVKIIKNLESGEKAAAANVKLEPRVKKLVFKDSSEAAKFVAKVADERKADYIKILNVGPRLAITDYFVIIGAGNTRLTRRIAEDIQANLKKYNIYAMHIEGAAEGNWILIDFDDFVVHIFTDEYRQYYDIERLWRDSKVIRLKASDTDIDEYTGTNAYPDEQSLFSDDGFRMEVKDI
jgi:ribosome-associated protein